MIILLLQQYFTKRFFLQIIFIFRCLLFEEEQLQTVAKTVNPRRRRIIKTQFLYQDDGSYVAMSVFDWIQSLKPYK